MSDLAEGIQQAIILLVTLNPTIIEITLRSLYITGTATLIASAISVPLGTYIAFNQFFGRKYLISIIQTLYAIPTVVVGLLVYMLITNNGPFGMLGLLFTPGGMIIGQMVLIIPIITGLTISALSGIRPVIRDTIVSLGADTYQFLVTMIKQARFAIIAAIIMGFSRAISEVGAALMLGGNIRGHTRVLTTTISLETSMGDFPTALALGIILLGIALVVNLALSLLQQGSEK